ncbi:BTB/POZ domain-containing protein 9-like protein [Leptotrombidium deliense]|uniref:BTB/POZ domain-containing protein 9-like protein n=1 Tax=Leptotrombidium deliense TaxID=299467 RepID=A0A443SIB2_9ACAR|nr:BTB/POZ domain-containing protein 9-like protein [Leptotrombidium deliense]
MTVNLRNVKLTLENVSRVYDILSENNANEKEVCLRFLELNAGDLVANKDLFSKLSFNLVRELVRRDTFCVREIDLFQALKNWHQCNTEHVVEEVFRDIRLNLVSAPDFGNVVKPTNVISCDDYFDAFDNPKQPRMQLPTYNLPIEYEFSNSISKPTQTYEVNNYSRLAKPTGEEEMNVVNLALRLWREEPPTKVEDGVCIIELILKLIELRVTQRNYSQVSECLSVLMTLLNVTSEVHLKEYCVTFFKLNGLQCLLSCMEVLKIAIINLKIFRIFKSIILVDDFEYFPFLNCDELLNKCFEFATNSSDFNLRYIGTFILLFLCLERTSKNEVEQKYELMMFELMTAMKKWSVTSFVEFEKIVSELRLTLTMARRSYCDSYKLFALWTFYYKWKSESPEIIINTNDLRLKSFLERFNYIPQWKETIQIFISHITKSEQSFGNIPISMCKDIEEEPKTDFYSIPERNKSDDATNKSDEVNNGMDDDDDVIFLEDVDSAAADAFCSSSYESGSDLFTDSFEASETSVNSTLKCTPQHEELSRHCSTNFNFSSESNTLNWKSNFTSTPRSATTTTRTQFSTSDCFERSQPLNFSINNSGQESDTCSATRNTTPPTTNMERESTPTYPSYLLYMNQQNYERCKCKHCGAQFVGVSNLEDHHRSVHKRGSNYICPVCNKEFFEKSSFRKHMRLVHDSSGSSRKGDVNSKMSNNTSETQLG